MIGAPLRVGWPLVWTLVGFLVVLLEGIALGQHQPGDTLSETIRTHVRFDPVGRVVFLPLWCWLTWHFALRPASITGVTWRDWIFIIIGMVWALVPKLAEL